MTKNFRLNEIAFAVGIFLLPFLPKVVFRLSWLMLKNFTDGVFYLGYALHFRELVDRVGLNYYADRFGSTGPDMARGAGFSLKKRLKIRSFSPHGVRSEVDLKEISVAERIR